MTITLMTARLLRRGLGGLVAVLFGIALFELINPVIADSLGGPGGLQALLEALPPAFQALARTQPEFLAVSGLAGYLSLGFDHPLYLILTATAATGFACRALAGEMERGTIQIALARPVSRPRVYAARVAGLAIIALLLAVAGPVGMLLGLALARPDGEVIYAHFLIMALVSWLLLWAVGGLTLLGSAAASTTGRAVAWATALLVLSYFIDYFADLWSIIEPLRPLSLYAYYDPATALVNGDLPVVDGLVLGLSGLAGVIGGLLIFVRRDLPT